MSVRSTVLAASVVVLSLVFYVAAASAGRAPSDRSAPTAPTTLRITGSTPTSVSLAWNASTDNSSNWWYCVRRDALGCIRVDPPRTTITFTRLMPNTTFNYSVIAIDSVGNRSGSSNTVSYTTPPDVTPPRSPTLSLTGIWPTRIALSWTQSVDDVSQVSSQLFADGSPYTGSLIGNNGLTVLDLAPSTTHVFKVVVRDQSGNTAESNVLTVTTPAAVDDVPPTAPTNLRLSSESSVPEIWLDWDQSTDDTDPQSQIMYDVYLNGEPEHASLGYGETIVYCRGEGPNTIAIRAVDSSGNESAFSNQIVFC